MDWGTVGFLIEIKLILKEGVNACGKGTLDIELSSPGVHELLVEGLRKLIEEANDGDTF